MTRARKPPVPAGLKHDRVASAKYRELVELKVWRDAIEVIGADLVIEFCLLHARRTKAETMLREQGELVTTPNGYQVQSPWLPIANRAASDMARIAKLVSGVIGSMGKKQAAKIASVGAAKGKYASGAPPKLVHSR